MNTFSALSYGFAAAVLGFFSSSVYAESASHATELNIRVVGATEPLGRIGCSLFASPEGFPMDNSSARVIWQDASPDGIECRFDDVAPGTYAVSVGHDVNGNKIVDTNFLGIPTEQWGVSNNARPRLRAPRFDEAAFDVPEPDADEHGDRKPLTLTVTVGK